MQLLDGLVDIYLPDFKVWNDSTSKRLLKADHYAEAAVESIKAMHDQVGDLCFTPDGIAKKGLLLRHLVMPGHESEGEEIMRWIAKNVSKDVFVNIMEQYHPDAHVGKARRAPKKTLVEPGGHLMSKDTAQLRYADINRHVRKEEISTVRSAAEKAGLWRFCDPPKHDGFAI
jgi:putative pyruvate formate lyase activating enzyme